MNQARAIAGRPKWPMSAYSASAPVMTSTMAPMATKAMYGWATTNDAAYVGDRPAITCGWRVMPPIPAIARTLNQTIMTGPNRDPTRPVPHRWTRNNPLRMIAATGSTTSESAGAATCSPSTADSTEMAGVMRLSP